MFSIAAMLGCNFETNFASDSYMIVLYMLLTAPIISIFLLGCSKYVADRNLGGKISQSICGERNAFFNGLQLSDKPSGWIHNISYTCSTSLNGHTHIEQYKDVSEQES